MKARPFLCAAALAACLMTIAAPAATLDATNAAPLPDSDQVLKRVLERTAQEEENDERFYAHYAFTLTKRTDTKNTKGELKKSEQKTTTYDPLTAPSAPAKRPRTMSEEDFKKNEAKGRAFDRKDFRLNPDLLKRFKFTIVARELIEGRSALLLDFVPASRNLPVKTFKDRFINRAAGRVWVDEADAAVVKVDLHLTEEVSVVGGLVGSVKKFLYSFMRVRTAEGWWFTSKVNWHLEGRQFLARKTMDYEEHRKDVKKVK